MSGNLKHYPVLLKTWRITDHSKGWDNRKDLVGSRTHTLKTVHILLETHRYSRIIRTQNALYMYDRTSVRGYKSVVCTMKMPEWRVGMTQLSSPIPIDPSPSGRGRPEQQEQVITMEVTSDVVMGMVTYCSSPLLSPSTHETKKTNGSYCSIMTHTYCNSSWSELHVPHWMKNSRKK